jgi:hypothetical protein
VDVDTESLAVVNHFAVVLIKVGWSYRRRKLLWPILLNVGVFALSPEEDILFMSMSKRTKTTTPFGDVSARFEEEYRLTCYLS